MFKFSLNWLRDYFEEEIKYNEIMNKLKLQGFEFGGKKEFEGDIITEIEVKANRPDMLYHMGIAREDTYAIGDSVNDLDMLAFVGHGIAMGNATQVAKDAAEYITTSLHEEGIYTALKHYGLI